MINEKGLSPESADLIGQYVCLHGMLFHLYTYLVAYFALHYKQHFMCVCVWFC